MSRPLVASEKQQIRLLLEKERETLTRQVQASIGADVPVELDQNRQGRLSRMDALQGQAMLKAGLQRHRVQLEEIARALANLDSEDFGRCDECGEWIPTARLELNPTVKHCVSCAARHESR